MTKERRFHIQPGCMPPRPLDGALCIHRARAKLAAKPVRGQSPQVRRVCDAIGVVAGIALSVLTVAQALNAPMPFHRAMACQMHACHVFR